MGSLFTFALGAVSALILVPVLVSSRHRHRHRHAVSAGKPVRGKAAAKAGNRRGK